MNYKEVNGTSYKVETPQQVIDILERSRQNRIKIRVFFGDKETGRDWMEEYDTMGIVGRSTGDVKIPLLLAKNSSFGGGALMDNKIVKITIDKKIVYQHENYKQPKLNSVEPSEGLKQKGYTNSVMCEGVNVANFKSPEKAEKYIQFIKGDRNAK